jgi:hypothetical protein
VFHGLGVHSIVFLCGTSLCIFFLNNKRSQSPGWLWVRACCDCLSDQGFFAGGVTLGNH